jgi:hypothetical protein
LIQPLVEQLKDAVEVVKEIVQYQSLLLVDLGEIEYNH